jgi:hypothetical protein
VGLSGPSEGLLTLPQAINDYRESDARDENDIEVVEPREDAPKSLEIAESLGQTAPFAPVLGNVQNGIEQRADYRASHCRVALASTARCGDTGRR